MACLLFANELGEGLGHVNRLIEVARRLAGHALTFAVQGNLQRDALRAALGTSVRSVVSPRLPSRAVPDDGVPDATLADTLRRIGFADRVGVASAVEAWARLVEDVRPDVIVSDYAPSLRAAVAGHVPQVEVGNGFTVPPAVAPLPTFADAEPPGARSRDAEAAVLDCLDAVRAARELPPFARLADALRGDATFVVSHPLLDPYRTLRERAPLQPFDLPPVVAGPPAAARTGPAVFAYLDANYAGVNVVLDALNRLGRRAEIFVRHAAPAEVVRHCAPHVGVYSAPADLARVLPQTRLLVHHCGPATSVAGLLAGVPQLLLPRQQEQLLYAKGLATLGTSLALGIDTGADADRLQGYMQQLLDSPAIADRALAAAREFQDGRVADAERPVIEAIEALLREPDTAQRRA